MNMLKLVLSCFIICASFFLNGFKFGIENDAYNINKYKKLRIGLVTNQTGLTHDGRRTVQVLQDRGFNIVVLLAPEHGIDGTIPAAEPITDQIDEQTGLSVISLYAGGDKTKEIPERLLNQVDAFFFDIQDSGMRHYTYISTLYKLLEFCAVHKTPVIVFDRPNPLGDVMEGPLVDQELISFISIAPIPLRHGLTIGELARYFNEQVIAQRADLTVVPMIDYDRRMQPEPLLAPLSPNLKTLPACFGYSFLGILGEVHGIFIGARTHKPFGILMVDQAVALSSSKLLELRLLLRKYGISSTPAVFVNRLDQKKFQGLIINIDYIMRVSSFNCLVHVLAFLNRIGVSLKTSALFDKAVGTSLVRLMISGQVQMRDIAHVVNDQLKKFDARVRPYLLYNPAPRALFLRVE